MACIALCHNQENAADRGRGCSSTLLLWWWGCSSSFAQLQNNNWTFGNGCRVNFNGPTPNGALNSFLFSGEQCATVSDPQTGSLLFYSDGLTVWGPTNQPMTNGTGLIGGLFKSSCQGPVIIPFPENPNKYFIFTIDELEFDAYTGLHYSVVDMTLNGGLGDVEAANKNILLTPDSLTEKITVIENDLEFKIDLKNGQKTGWFFDQAVNRNFVASLVKDCDVFDGFCYVGGFGINAVKAQARSVIFADSSKEALDLTRENCQKIVEKFNPTCETSFYNKKIFDLLEDVEFQKRSFDVVLLDPPAFVKNKKDLFSGLRGYEKLVKLACPLLKKNGYLIITSCSHHVSTQDLVLAVQHALHKSHKNGKLIRTYGAGFDHPIHPALKENEYLKCLTFFIE